MVNFLGLIFPNLQEANLCTSNVHTHAHANGKRKKELRLTRTRLGRSQQSMEQDLYGVRVFRAEVMVLLGFMARFRGEVILVSLNHLEK